MDALRLDEIRHHRTGYCAKQRRLKERGERGRVARRSGISFECPGCRHHYQRYSPSVLFQDILYCPECYSRYVRLCVTCANVFFTKTNNKKNCSDSCVLAYEKARALERAKNRDISFHFGENK